jgi:8-oxo-dGTP diphosphatase
MKHATLLFLQRDGQILLAMKKRGLGVGKWNGVGGKADPGESIVQTAIRECQEEINVTPIEPQLVGELHFITQPDIEFYCHIFTTTQWEGTPAETEEMRPQWFSTTDIPYASMWPDDEFWLPKLLAGQHFRGKVVIDQHDVIQECRIDEVKSL